MNTLQIEQPITLVLGRNKVWQNALAAYVAVDRYVGSMWKSLV